MIVYKDSADGLTPQQLKGFFEGWAKPLSPETHLSVLRRSSHIVLAIDDTTDSVVGFITAISDGVLSAYVPLLEVLAEHRGKGIGQALVRRMLAILGDIYMVDLTCDPELVSFYEKLGFKKGCAMMIRDRS